VAEPVEKDAPGEEVLTPTRADGAPVFSVRELLCLVFQVDPVFQDSTRITQALNKFQISSFAKANFREHLHGNALARKFRPRPVSLQDLISYQTSPISKPLLKKIPKNKKRAACLLFELLLEFMQLRPVRAPRSPL
jgi:hypothetical protein